jgi:hypothetical protein
MSHIFRTSNAKQKREFKKARNICQRLEQEVEAVEGNSECGDDLMRQVSLMLHYFLLVLWEITKKYWTKLLIPQRVCQQEFDFLT